MLPMCSYRARLLATTIFSNPDLAREESWYIDGTGTCEVVSEFPCGKGSYDFKEIRGYDFPGIALGAHTPLIEKEERHKYIRFRD